MNPFEDKPEDPEEIYEHDERQPRQELDPRSSPFFPDQPIYRQQPRPGDNNWNRQRSRPMPQNQDRRFDPHARTNDSEVFLDNLRGRDEFKSLFGLFARFKGSRFVDLIDHRDTGFATLPAAEIKKIYDSFDLKIKEIDYMESANQENIMEESHSLLNYTKLKKANIYSSYLVFKQLQEGHTFRSHFLRIQDMVQAEACLPIYAKKTDFMTAYQDSQVLIVKSTAGSGKSTQMPQYLLDCCKGRIIVTQPRVIAAQSVARRVQDELSESGLDRRVVGYIAGPQFRIDSKYTEIVYLTEHEFLNQMLNDRTNFLDSFEAFVLDEAHELRKTTMIILAILSNYIKRYPEKKSRLIVTSATLDTDIFLKYFEDLKTTLVSAETPTHSVEVFYTFFPDLSNSILENTLAHLKLIFEHISKNFDQSRDRLPNVLVFLPSIKEIKEVSGLIFQDTDKSFETIEKMLPFHIEELHGGLRPSEKDQVFNPCPSLQRKVRVILATKIAETAITLEDVYYVLDSGKETEYFFDEESQMDFHKQMDISLSSAIQRKGRAGRIANGFCFKMYKQEEEMEFRLTSTPEILRMDITDILMTQIELVDFFLSSDLLYYDQIKEEKVNSLTAELKRIKALEDQNDRTVLTSKGRFMIQSGLKALTGAFLFECIRYGAKELGLIAATAIQGTRNVFRNNDAVKKFCEIEIDRDRSSQAAELTNLGDLAPLIWIFKRYEKIDPAKKKKFHNDYSISEKEMKKLFTQKEQIEFQINLLSNLYPSVDPAASRLTKEEAMQLSFVKTYPRNICISADESKEFQYFMMIRSKELIKIHGSSIMSSIMSKPKWVCCQNLVISGVTHRPMAKFIVPIKDNVLEETEPADFKKAKKMDELKLPQKVLKTDVPSAIMSFLRSKNHNEYIQKHLQANKAYLELDFDRERIIYFYIRDHKNEQKNRLAIAEMQSKIWKEAVNSVLKRNYITPISDKTKLHIDEFGEAVDILDSNESIGFLIRSAKKEIADIVMAGAKILQIRSSDFLIQVKHYSNIILVYLKDKIISRALFEYVKKKSYKYQTAIFPLTGNSKNNYAGKFQKWKVEIVWYEGPKEDRARINFENRDVALEAFDKVKNLRNLRIQIGKVGFNNEFKAKGFFFDIDNALSPGVFRDEFEIQDTIKKTMADISTSKNKNFFVQVWKRNNEQDHFMVNDDNEPQENIEFNEAERDRVRDTIANFARGKSVNVKEIKELKFIRDARLPVELASEVDVEMRKKLEKLFPILKKYNMLCFKAKRSTGRRALIFPARSSYQVYTKDMRELIKFSDKFYEALGSKVRFQFRGKYVLKFKTEIFKKFEVLIRGTIDRFNLIPQERVHIDKVEISLVSNQNKSEDLRNCVMHIMSFVAEKFLDYSLETRESKTYAFTCQQGLEFLQHVNAYYLNKVFLRFDEKMDRLVLSGEPAKTKEVEGHISEWLKGFLASVVVEDFKLQNPKIYFQTKKQALWAAKNLNCWLSLEERNQRFYINIFSNNYLKKGERERKEAMEENRAYNVKRLKEKLGQIFFERDDMNTTLMSMISEEMRRDFECPICGCFIEKRYRLFCGHYFCDECLKGHVENAGNTGLICPAENCNEGIFLVDLINIMNQEDLRKLFLKKVRPFLQTHQTEFKQCPSSNCDNILINHKDIGSVVEYCKRKRTSPLQMKKFPKEMRDRMQGLRDVSMNDVTMEQAAQEKEAEDIIRESLEQAVEQEQEMVEDPQQQEKEDEKKRLLVFCECCGHDYCFNCLKNHYETECEVDQVIQEMVRAGLFVKNCPGCRAPFEKKSGCSHMECPFCRTHFCNECHKNFGVNAPNKQIYDHLVQEHGHIQIEGEFEDLEQGLPPQEMQVDDGFD